MAIWLCFIALILAPSSLLSLSPLSRSMLLPPPPPLPPVVTPATAVVAATVAVIIFVATVANLIVAAVLTAGVLPGPSLCPIDYHPSSFSSPPNLQTDCQFVFCGDCHPSSFSSPPNLQADCQFVFRGEQHALSPLSAHWVCQQRTG
jgi:hypothetical protein